MTSTIIPAFEQALLNVDPLSAKGILKDAGKDLQPLQFIEEVVMPVMDRIGSGWEKGSIALSQVYMSGRICEDIVDEILPPEAPERKDQPKMAIAVFEDYHLLGKRMVYSMLRASGFELLDYNHVSGKDIISRVKKDGIQILLLSTLMLPSALHIKQVRDNLDDSVKIVVGGAPFRFDNQLWREIGADAMGNNAAEAVEIINQLISGEIS